MVAAGQVYSAEGPRIRYILVLQMRAGDPPYAWCREVTRSGRKPQGTDRLGVTRAQRFKVLCPGGKMPSWYSLTEWRLGEEVA